MAALGWQGTSTERLGEWLLRAGSGFTGRANSVLPLGSPGCALDDALGCVTEFYRGHDLPPLFQIPVGPETRSWKPISTAGAGQRSMSAGCWSPTWRPRSPGVRRVRSYRP